MDLKALVPTLIQISTMLIIFAVGLKSRWADLGHALARPGLLARGFVAVYVAVPLTAFAAAMLLPIEPAVRVAIIAMGLAPLAPMAPGKMLQAGADGSYAIGMYVGLILLAAIAVPATMLLLGSISGGGASIRPGMVAWLVGSSVLAPLLAGIVLGSLVPAAAGRFARIVSVVGSLTLALLVVLIFIAVRGELLGLVGNGTLLAIVLAELAGLVAGHLLGGPDPHHRMALAQAAACRHPGLAILLIRQNFDIEPRSLAAVLVYLVVGALVSAGYSRWAGRRIAEAEAEAAGALGAKAPLAPVKSR